MKVLRIFGNIIIGLILFSLIISLSFVYATKTFFEKDLAIGLVKVSIIDYIDRENSNTDVKKDEILNEIFDDRDTDKIVQLVFDNYKKYQQDKTNYSVSDSDVEILTSYAFKYKGQISKISSKAEEVSDEELKEILSKENINKIANSMYSEIDSNSGEEVDKAFDIYEKITTTSIIIAGVFVVVLFIVILGLINWSLYKWMITTGVCFIISGVIMSLTYLACAFFNEIISSVDILNKVFENINFSAYIIIGGIELIVGIILIVVYNSLKNRKFNEQIENLGVGE